MADTGHLVLTRRETETVVLELPDGRDVLVTVHRGAVYTKLGITAPKDVVIRREELPSRRES